MKAVLFLVFITLSISLKSQNDSTNYKASSFLQIGAGVGAPYGIGGVRSVIGYKGNGLVFGLGLSRGKLARQVGCQLSYKWLFFMASLGDYASYRDLNTGDFELASGQTVLTGAHFDISGTKRIFLEFGMGYSWGERIRNQDGELEDLNKIAYSAGILFNI